MLNKTLSCALALTLLSTAAMAADGDQMKDAATQAAAQPASFEALDADKDGRVSLTEAAADSAVTEGFSTADKNADGYLDAKEFGDMTEPKS
ncbi:MAG TPA: hypothetical protein P5528_13410 [Steroidobacteraceae bacterium]|nr:hypothetical protein [Steroidobacteraceae bacterium]HRX90433.1 hypothetical protein [Steroidobacteraceae bacterium]